MMGPGLHVETFDGMTLLGRRYWSRIVDSNNHEILYPSQTYKTVEQRDATARRIARALRCPLVIGKRR